MTLSDQDVSTLSLKYTALSFPGNQLALLANAHCNICRALLLLQAVLLPQLAALLQDLHHVVCLIQH